jgi:formamidopyrimidine-DNA glycosylase
MAGQTIAALERRGKQLALITDSGRVLCVHLGMTGRLQVLPPGGQARTPPHLHCLWRLRGLGGLPMTLAFSDPRRFGGIWTFPSMEALLKTRWSCLGPDASAIRASQLTAALARSASPIKAALLDQARLAGLGNIYADEALFSARLHPARPAGSLSRAEVTTLARSIRRILHRASNAGGSTLRDYVDANGNPGRAQQLHIAYGRSGKPCVSCGHNLSLCRIAQRTTTYCERCQRRNEG